MNAAPSATIEGHETSSIQHAHAVASDGHLGRRVRYMRQVASDRAFQSTVT